MDIKQVTENKAQEQQPQEETEEQQPQEETEEQQPQEKNTQEETQERQPQEHKHQLNTLYKIYLFKDGIKTNKYYFYCNKANPAFNLYKAKKNKKLTKYCKQNDYTIENIYALAHLTSDCKKLYLKEVLKDTKCINNLFNRKQNKKDNKTLPTVKNKEELKEFLTH